jgi:DNA-binding MarR family transcriptional regulator
MDDVKQHEYDLLNEIGQDSLVTQASLSDRLGIAVGSVNWYIKRLINRGWIKVSHLDRTRLKYDLTPEGMSVFTQRALQYMKSSLSVYRELREQARNLVLELKSQGVPSVYLQGDDERMDIMRLTCIENGLSLDDAPEQILIRANGQNFQVVHKKNSHS